MLPAPIDEESMHSGIKGQRRNRRLVEFGQFDVQARRLRNLYHRFRRSRTMM